jgi:hypothetical protein
LIWYGATVIVLAISLRFLSWYGLLLLWGIGLGWGIVLAVQFSRLLFSPDDTAIKEEKLQSYLDQAASYKTNIDQTIAATGSPAERVRLEQIGRQIDAWTEAINKLADRLGRLRQDEVIRQDTQRVPAAIVDLEKRLDKETDPAMKAQLERTLANRRKQLEALRQLQNTMVRAEMQIESTVSMLGTIYSQILTGQSTSDVAVYRDLSAEVDEEVKVLEDHLEALREVKLGGE